ncbi:hypothetical protein U8V72_11330 [Priestia filamentosa]|uniref:hypothetical protein n=1 Tax=Priestia filamentosa TaxID=1402861 RepID=UPI000A4B96D8
MDNIKDANFFFDVTPDEAKRYLKGIGWSQTELDKLSRRDLVMVYKVTAKTING